MTFLLAGAVVCLLAGNGVASPSDTAAILGRVVAADDGKPLARAEVHLQGDRSRAVLTDDKGRYAFTDLPAGRFTISAGRTGYVTVGYGQHQSTDPLQPITLATGESRKQVDFVLPRGGVIEVIVVDQFGDPVEGAYVRAWRDRAPDSAMWMQRQLEPAQSAPWTDDRGRVRLYDLPLGTYFLSANPMHTQAVPPMGRFEPGLPGLAYQNTFYPGTTLATEAEPVVLASGHELSVSIPVRPTPIAQPANQSATPPANPPANQVAPIGRISGRVMSQDGPRPLAHAIVTLASVAQYPINRTKVTDDDGRYTFDGLPDGQYTVGVERLGFLTRAYGQRPPWMNVHTVRVAGGVAAGSLDVLLPGAGVLTVRVTDEFGQPQAGVGVNLRQISRVRGRRQLALARLPHTLMEQLHPKSFETDDRGEIRLHNLPPGDYVVRAEPHPFPIVRPPRSSKADDRELLYSPTYFPGTTLASEAQPVTIGIGQELTVAIPIAPALATHVSGRVVNADGTPGRGTVSLYEYGADGGAGPEFSDELVGGAFTFRNLQPGDYRLVKEADTPEDENGSMTVTVAGENISGLVLTTVPPGSLRGHVIFDTGAPPEDLIPGEQKIEANDAESGHFVATRLTPDWTFALEGVTTPSLLHLDSGWDDWIVKEVTLGGVDVTETPLQTADDLEVVVTRQSVIMGTIVDRTGTMVINCGVMLFAAAGDGAAASDYQFVDSSATGYLGRFGFDGLLPGHYFVAQVPKALTEEPGDPPSLATLMDVATPVTIGAGETRTLTLTLSLPDRD